MAASLTPRQLVIMIVALEFSSALITGVLVGVLVSPALGVALFAAILAFPFVLLPMVMFLMSGVTGWRTLARRFPGHIPIEEGEASPLHSVALHRPWWRYNNIVHCSADEEHLHLWLPRFFGAGHAPVSIPWAAVTTIEDGRMGMARLDAGGIRIWVPDKLVENERRLRAEMEEAGITGHPGAQPT